MEALALTVSVWTSAIPLCASTSLYSKDNEKEKVRGAIEQQVQYFGLHLIGKLNHSMKQQRPLQVKQTKARDCKRVWLRGRVGTEIKAVCYKTVGAIIWCNQWDWCNIPAWDLKTLCREIKYKRPVLPPFYFTPHYLKFPHFHFFFA